MATIRDVAKRAGVAPITVSRVLNHSGYVSPETRVRVEEAAAALNFVPNMLAHSLRSNRTQTLALVLSDITNPFWTTVARGVEDEANRHSFIVIFGNTDESEAKQDQYISALLRRRVDGVILVPATSSGAAVEALKMQGVKVVVLDRRLPGVEVDMVRGASVGGARRLVEHLIGYGHRCIAILSGPADISVSDERIDGYGQALAAAQLPVDAQLISHGAFTVESGYERAQTVLALRPRPTALFAANNFIALGALRALHELRLRVPEDCSLAVFDDLPATYAPEPFLTVVAQPAYALGQTAAALLLRRLEETEEGPPQDIELPIDLIIRASTGPAPDAP